MRGLGLGPEPTVIGKAYRTKGKLKSVPMGDWVECGGGSAFPGLPELPVGTESGRYSRGAANR